MHSRILGVMPLADYEQLSEDPVIDYEETPYFADYIDHDTDLDKDFNWFIEILVNRSMIDFMDVDIINHTIKFKPGFKQVYFKNRFNTFVKTVMSPEMFDTFCGEGKLDIYSLKKMIEEEYDFYIADEYGGYETMDSFLRRVDYDTEYKVFQSIDYHF